MATAVISTPRGIPVSQSPNGLPVTVSTNGFGLGVTPVASGGLPVTETGPGGLFDSGSDVAPNYRMRALVGSFVFTGEQMTVQAGYTMTAQAGAFTLAGQNATLPGAGYAGPGDLTPGAVVWFGLRAYSSARLTGTTKAIRVCTNTFANQQDILILPTGLLDYAGVSGLNAWIAAHGPTAYVMTWYDQSGNGSDLVQGAISNCPTITVSPAGLTAGRAALTFSGAVPQQLSSGTSLPATAQPCTLSMMFSCTGATAGVRSGLAVGSGSSPRFGMESGQFFMYAGGALLDFGTAAYNTWYATQAVYDDPHSSSHVNVTSVAGGTSNTGNQSIGTSNFGGSLVIGVSGGGDAFTGYITEIGGWNGSVAAGMGANQIASR
jgi:hypothetical protein